MNISYKWLKEYVDFDLTPQEVCDALTSTGLEVDALEEVQSIKGGLKGLYVGKVLTCEQHPNSDHLHVTTVDLGRETPSQIVCGAPNVAAGQKVIVADLGCVLYDGDKEFVIKKSKLRGVDSYGMICAEDEIGVGTSHDGIIVLPDDAQVGQTAAEYYNLESDWLIEIDITANRADALSHWGVARDLYAWLKRNGHETSLHRPDCSAFTVDNNTMPVEVTIENTDACKRYACVSITGCDVKESPAWLQEKLRVIGLRPINNIVDITNYIMMAYGQPLHCFDADMVTGHHIIVRTMPEGTPFVTLDGVEHKLGTHDLAICNTEEAMCIAGVFGGKGSGTYETTKNVVLESAYFHPTWIRKSARRHGLSTDASFRFERGIDPNGIIYALKQAAIMCKELAGGKVSMEIKDVYPEPINDFKVSLKYDYVNSLIGKEIPADMVKSIVTSLDMKIDSETAEGLADVRKKMVKSLIRRKVFYHSKLFGKYWRIIIDGTGLFYFREKHCENCLVTTITREEDGKEVRVKRYYHKVLEAKLVLAPGITVSLDTEFIENENEDVSKNDCELNAAKRLLDRLSRDYPRLPICLQGDALYAVEPIMEICRGHGWKYILTHKASRQKVLAENYAWIAGGGGAQTIKGIGKERGRGEYINHVEESAGKKEEANMYSYRYETKGAGTKELHEFQWITNIELTRKNLEEMIEAGRGRWKIENEGFNNQKNGNGIK